MRILSAKKRESLRVVTVMLVIRLVRNCYIQEALPATIARKRDIRRLNSGSGRLNRKCQTANEIVMIVDGIQVGILTTHFPLVKFPRMVIRSGTLIQAPRFMLRVTNDC